ncbi:metallohydrolase [Chitinispirillum alkaliphilum]|nr:metallohydrolase [Chitinispirillum alkaliphilum]
MKFSVLRSGSSGNCTYIENKNTRVLLDAGLPSRKKIVGLLDEIGVDPESIDAVVCTHLHSDHLNKSTLSFCRTFSVSLWIHNENAPFFSSRFTGKCRCGVDLLCFDKEMFRVGDICFQPFGVIHDADGVTSGFRFYADGQGNGAVGYAADIGSVSEELIEALSGVSVLCFEANHDPELLWKNQSRTYLHKRRVTGGKGHLSNHESGKAIATLLGSSSPPSRVILCHLSEDHNSPDLAKEQVNQVLSENGLQLELITASRKERTDFFDLSEGAVDTELEKQVIW